MPLPASADRTPHPLDWAKLEAGEAGVPDAVRTGLLDFVAGRMSRRGDRWVKRIERRRTAMLQSDRMVRALVTVGGYDKSEPVTYRHGEIRLGAVVARATKRPIWCRMLFTLADALKPRAALELGTCVGVSSAYIAAGIKPYGGRLVTLEGSHDFSAVAAESMAEIKLAEITTYVPGLFQDTLAGVLTQAGAWDFVFIDGHHDGEATLRYLDQIFPRLAETALVIFDDIRWSPGMERAWDTIVASGRFPLNIDMRELGVCALYPSDRVWRVDLTVDAIRDARAAEAVAQSEVKRAQGAAAETGSASDDGR